MHTEKSGVLSPEEHKIPWEDTAMPPTASFTPLWTSLWPSQAIPYLILSVVQALNAVLLSVCTLFGHLHLIGQVGNEWYAG